MQGHLLELRHQLNLSPARSDGSHLSDLEDTVSEGLEIAEASDFESGPSNRPQLDCVAEMSLDEVSLLFPDEEPDSHVRITREQRRSRRKREVRARSINIARVARKELQEGTAEYPVDDAPPLARPLTREECASLPRPCPFVSCRHHLYLDVSPRTGSIKLNFPDLEVWELGQSCSLDVADQGPLGPEELGAIMNLTRERVRQLQQQSLDKARFDLETVTHQPTSASW